MRLVSEWRVALGADGRRTAERYTADLTVAAREREGDLLGVMVDLLNVRNGQPLGKRHAARKR